MPQTGGAPQKVNVPSPEEQNANAKVEAKKAEFEAKEKTADAARIELQEATASSKDTDRLKAALDTGKNVGLEEGEMEDAKTVLAKEGAQQKKAAEEGTEGPPRVLEDAQHDDQAAQSVVVDHQATEQQDEWLVEIAPLVELKDKSYGENDEGDYDYYSRFELLFKRKGDEAPVVLWSGSCHRGSNVSCAWGQQMRARLSPDKKELHVQVTDVKESIGNAQNERGKEEFVNVPQELLQRGLLTAKQFEDAKKNSTTVASAPPSGFAIGATWQLHSDPWK